MAEKTVAYTPGQYNKVSAIVDRFLFMNGLPDAWWQWALEAGLWEFRELNLDVAQQPKTELLPVTDRKTVILSPGFVDWVIVAAPVGQYYVTMGVNPKLRLTDRNTNDTVVAGLLSQNLPNGLDFNAYGGFTLYNYNGVSIRSIGCGFSAKGMFRVKETGLIKELLLDYDYNYSHIYLESITDGLDLCGETILNPYYCDFFYKAIAAVWEDGHNPSRTEASIRRKQQDLAQAIRVVRARKNDLDPQTLLNISRQQTRFTPHI